MTGRNNLKPPFTVKSLTRTPLGSIYVNDLKDIFSTLLFQLDLSYKEPKKSIFSLVKKDHNFSFTVSNAIEILGKLNLEINYGSTVTRISYEIKPKFAMELLQIFFHSKMLHCPDDKTMSKLTSKMIILQPTPKGVAILHSFCLKFGIYQVENIKLPKILNSNFNTMELITFERHSRTDSIIHNVYSDKILFLQVMGRKMNIWSALNGPDSIDGLGNYFNKFEDKSNFLFSDCLNSSLEPSSFFAYLKQRQAEAQHLQKQNDIEIKKEKIWNPLKQDEITPFYHRFYTNPDSDSHVQYYTSNCGLRFFFKRIIKVNGKEKSVYHCFSGKAIVQFLMDCTDIIYYNKAVKVASVFLKLGLIENQTEPAGEFIDSKSHIYNLTNKGYELLQWPKKIVENIIDPLAKSKSITIESSSENFEVNSCEDFNCKAAKNISLFSTLHDPGLKYLFRQFLTTNLCSENLNAYDDITDFQRKMSVLKKLLRFKNKAKRDIQNSELMELINDISSSSITDNKIVTIRMAIKKLSEKCLMSGYNIYALYLSDNAPNGLNIDFKLKEGIKELVSSKFDLMMMPLDSKELEHSLVEDRKGFPDCSARQEVNDNIDNVPLKNSLNSSLTTTIKEAEKYPNTTPTLQLQNYKNLALSISSPTTISLGPSLKVLIKMETFYDEVKINVGRMMESDSLDKFLNSDIFNNIPIALPQ